MINFYWYFFWGGVSGGGRWGWGWGEPLTCGFTKAIFYHCAIALATVDLLVNDLYAKLGM